LALISSSLSISCPFQRGHFNFGRMGHFYFGLRGTFEFFDDSSIFN
jgi:hypothetical protein